MDCPLCEVEHPRGSDRCPARRVGRVVDGRYRLEGLIGCGGMGAVYEATQLGLGRRVALKTMLDRGLRNAEALLRFRREATAIAAIRHPGIVQVQDLGNDADGSPFMVMERLEGSSVADLLDLGPLPFDRVRWIAREALDALAAAHEHGLVHRDVKPSNLFVAKDGRGGEQVKLLDFGLAKVLDEGRELTRTGLAMGSAPYMSPEQAEDSKRVDARTDVYGMGATLFEMLTGYLPVSGGSDVEVLLRVAAGEITRHPRFLRREVPASLDEVVARALEHSPAARFPTARDMNAALEQAATVASPDDLAAAAALASAPTLAGEPVPRSSRARRASTLATTTPVAAVPMAPSVPGAPVATTPVAAAPAPPRTRLWPWLGAAVFLAVLAGAALALGSAELGSAPPPPSAPSVALTPPLPAPAPPSPAPAPPAPPAPAPVDEVRPVTPVTSAPSPALVAEPATPTRARTTTPQDEDSPLPPAPPPSDEGDDDDDHEPPGEGALEHAQRTPIVGAPSPPPPDDHDERDEPAPNFDEGPVVQGQPTEAQIRAVIQGARGRIRRDCGSFGMFFLFGTVAGSNGALIDAQPGLARDDADCVERVLRRVRFPRSTMNLYTFQITVTP